MFLVIFKLMDWLSKILYGVLDNQFIHFLNFCKMDKLLVLVVFLVFFTFSHFMKQNGRSDNMPTICKLQIVSTGEVISVPYNRFYSVEKNVDEFCIQEVVDYKPYSEWRLCRRVAPFSGTKVLRTEKAKFLCRN